MLFLIKFKTVYFVASKFCNLFYLMVLFLSVCISHGNDCKIIPADWNVDTEDFKSLVTNGIFVDKSLFINETINNRDKVFQIIRPRKWGKSVNLNMVKRFFDVEVDRYGNILSANEQVNKVIFLGGNITVNSKLVNLKPLKVSLLNDIVHRHMGNHPVIHLSFKYVKGSSYSEFEEKLKDLISNLYKSYGFLNNFLDDDNDILDLPEKARLAQYITGSIEDENFVSCFEFLSMLLYKYFHSEVVLLIDDYDFPIISAYLEFGDKNREFDSIVIMFRVLLESAFKENQYLFRGMLTGTLNFPVVSTGLSEYHFIQVCTILDEPFTKSFGFTQKDLGELLSKVNLSFNPYYLRKWYGGIHLHEMEIFNPLSVMKCISWKGKYDYYLHRSFATEFTRLIDEAFLLDHMQEFFHLLIEGKEIKRSVMADSVYMRGVSSDYYSIFVHAGYLELIPPERMTDRPIWKMKIPNMDIRGIFASGVASWVCRELSLTKGQYESFTNSLMFKQIDNFRQELENILTKIKCGDTERTTEEWYHNLMAGIVCSLGMKYLVNSEKDVGFNKGGHLLVPFEGKGVDGVVIEYRICKLTHLLESTVEEGFTEMLNNTREFDLKINDYRHLKRIIFVTLGFSGPKVVTKYKIADI